MLNENELNRITEKWTQLKRLHPQNDSLAAHEMIDWIGKAEWLDSFSHLRWTSKRGLLDLYKAAWSHVGLIEEFTQGKTS